jgi:hypothetical protein
MIRQQQSDSGGQCWLQVAQIIVFLLELGHPQLSLGRFRQRLLGGGIGAAVREFGWLGYRHLAAGSKWTVPRRSVKTPWNPMSALPPKADIGAAQINVRLVPTTDMTTSPRDFLGSAAPASRILAAHNARG